MCTCNYSRNTRHVFIGEYGAIDNKHPLGECQIQMLPLFGSVHASKEAIGKITQHQHIQIFKVIQKKLFLDPDMWKQSHD